MLLPGVDASLGVLTQRIQAVRSVATRVEDALRTSRPDAENTAETELFESFSEEVIRILHSKAMEYVGQGETALAPTSQESAPESGPAAPEKGRPAKPTNGPAKKKPSGPPEKSAPPAQPQQEENKKRSPEGEHPAAPKPKSTPSYAAILAVPDDNNSKSLDIRATKTKTKAKDKQAAPDTSKHRIFLRLPADSPQRHAGAAETKKFVVRHLGVNAEDLKTVKQVNTGFALSFDSQTTMAAALTKMDKASAVFSGCTVDTATKWHTYVINRVPKNTRNLVGQVSLVTIQRIEEEIESQLGVCATRVAWSKHNQDSSPTSSIVFSLEKPLRTSLKLFGSSAPAIKARQHERVQQCDACFGFHRTDGCPRKELCPSCGQRQHVGPCPRPVTCVNCHGPHPSKDLDCPVRPYVRNGIVRQLPAEAIKKIRAGFAQKPTPKAPETGTNEKSPSPTEEPLAPTTQSDVMEVSSDSDSETHSSPDSSTSEKNKADVVLLQEPYTFKDRHGAVRTKCHPNWDTFLPVADPETRPRAITFIRKEKGLHPIQLCPTRTGDCVWLQLERSGREIQIVNVYRHQETLAADLIRWLDPIFGKCLIAGDFNLHHPYWEPGVPISNGASVFADWIDEVGLSLTSPPGVPTHARGHTLDLCLSNIPDVESEIASTLDTTSDHSTIWTRIPFGKPIPPEPLPGYTLAAEKIPELRRTFRSLPLPHLPHPDSPPTTTLLDEAVECLNRSIEAALAATMERRKRASRRGTPWWNEDCKDAERAYKDAIQTTTFDIDNLIKAKKNLRNAVRRAKRSLNKERIADASTPDSLWKIARWRKPNNLSGSPPLQDGDRTVVTPLEKMDLLASRLLDRGDLTRDLNPGGYHTAPARRIDMDTEFSQAEVRRAVIGAKNSTPGRDGISVAILKALWGELEAFVTSLFSLCFRWGHHPAHFKHAEIVVIPKPDKDPSLPGSWRPIALLPCLGKGLERLIARKITFLALENSILHPQQFGALPKRSASDLVACVIHDIERNWAESKVSTLLTMDVKGAFDAVLPGRLQCRLREQGWPSYLTSWVGSFISDRKCRLRMGSIRSTGKNISCGVPQGSPVSPILFMLFLQPLISTKHRFSYADDVAILASGRSPLESVASAQSAAEKMRKWAHENGVEFAPNKTEVLHFTRSRLHPHPPVTIGGTTTAPKSSMRWLGFWLDSKLSFNKHVETWSTKGRKAANFLRSISNTQSGVPPAMARLAVIACVIPTAMYGAETYWPGLHRTSSRGNQVSTRAKHLANRIEGTLRVAMRAVLPVWKTTPSSALHREAAIAPALLLLENKRQRLAARWTSLDPAHPLVSRANASPETRLGRTLSLIEHKPPRPKLMPPPKTAQPTKKTKEGYDFSPLRKAADTRDILVYSDGSKLEDGRTGWGFVIFQGGHLLGSGRGSLGTNHEVYDAEIAGALFGLRMALQTPCTYLADNILVVLDNQAAHDCLLPGATPTDTSQDRILEFHSLAGTWPNRHRYPRVQVGQVLPFWVPGHKGIPGNEMADTLAKEGASLTPPPNLTPSIAHVHRVARERLRVAYAEWWATSAPTSYKDLGLTATLKAPFELTIPRKTLGWLLAARSHHGDFEEYHERMNHANFKATCSCGKRKDPLHLFFCWKGKRLSKVFTRRPIHMTIDDTLTTKQGARDFRRFVEETKFFVDICP
ncbi:uncharacterized protein BROUX77_000537 [Berkeleyomyces rouxiae]|uniref:uncharacterized protein n=1 Tax=Berkeleyomyces rouxiae TaxID=2035830 RepID=UPI003B7A0626